jgi:signal transduction histidine kinase
MRPKGFAASYLNMASFLSETAADRSAALAELRLLSLSRLVLSVLALLITFIDPTEPAGFAGATYASLIGYVVFSSVLHWFSQTKYELPASLRNPYWLDVGWYVLFIALSSGTDSVFFFFFYFAIINAAFTDGSRTGRRVAIVAAILFSLVGYFAAVAAGSFEVDRFLLRPVGLIVLGHLIAHWGGHQRKAASQLRLLREIGLISNPRFGVDRTLGINLNLLRRFFRAKQILLLGMASDSDEYRARICDSDDPTGAAESRGVDGAFASRLLELAGAGAIYYECKAGTSKIKQRAYDVDKQEFLQRDPEELAAIAELLDADTFMSAPVSAHGGRMARIFLHSKDELPFEDNDLEFLTQVLDHFIPIVNNIALIDQMASDAAEDERRRIARDIHDTVIQPYIGLQMGIESIKQLLKPENVIEKDRETLGVLRSRLARLSSLSEEAILDLRGYVRGLYGKRSESTLASSLERYTSKFSSATGIKVTTDVTDGLRISDRLAAEVFQLVSEGLSNVRRHTDSSDAFVNIASDARSLHVVIRNNRGPGDETPEFLPASIRSRATALGGSITVDRGTEQTAVSVEIPL